MGFQVTTLGLLVMKTKAREAVGESAKCHIPKTSPCCVKGENVCSREEKTSSHKERPANWLPMSWAKEAYFVPNLQVTFFFFTRTKETISPMIETYPINYCHSATVTLTRSCYRSNFLGGQASAFVDIRVLWVGLGRKLKKVGSWQWLPGLSLSPVEPDIFITRRACQRLQSMKGMVTNESPPPPPRIVIRQLSLNEHH